MFIEDLSIFFNSDEFAVEAVIQGIKVKGILEISYSTLNQVHYCKHFFTSAQMNILEITLEDEIKINDQMYRIQEINPDGTGLVSFSLELMA